ncbi:MAG TPA: ROK family protein [Verrucomicrobiae bacterium]|nr:ROK family protein [Verrucomicrobiae bacterium]
MDYSRDERVVMTLDAGGTNFRFSAIRGGKPVTKTLGFSSHGDNLDRCLATLREGFDGIRSLCPTPPVAISFAFPGPADYPAGIIGDLGNLPAFRGGVALGPMIAKQFGIPVFLNNDADLFAYGEAIGGFLPYVNSLLEKSGQRKRCRNLIGITLGTGLGGGVVRNGELFLGDNSIAAEVWLMRNKLHPGMNAEQNASIRGIRRVFAEKSGMRFADAPEPKQIFEIGTGSVPGNREAATEAFRQLGEVLGDVLGQALTILDGLVVIGGGLSGSWPLFMPAVMKELNGTYTDFEGKTFSRLASKPFNLEEPTDLEKFLRGEAREVVVPGSSERISYDPLQRVGIGISRLGTSEAVAVGAYAFALSKLNESAR